MPAYTTHTVKLKHIAKHAAAHTLLAAIFLGSSISHAEEQTTEKDSPWGVTFGAMSYLSEYKTENSDDDAGILLGVTYEGEDFHLTPEEAYYDLYETAGLSLSVVGRNFHTGFEDDTLAVFKDMEDRDVDFGLGVRAAYESQYGDLVATATTDVAGAHDSAIFALGYSYAANFGKLTLVPNAKVTKYSSDYMDYYYGVKASEATADRAAYDAKGGSIYTLGLTAHYAFNESWSVTGQVNQNFLPDTVKDSSLTNNDSSATSGLVAVNYAF